MAGIKIVDLPAVGRDLAATDLFEMSLVGGTGSRKITGQEIMNASKLSVGSTPVINGTIGRILFEGAGNVLQESANLFWDNTNARLGIGTSTPAANLEINGTFRINNTGVSSAYAWSVQRIQFNNGNVSGNIGFIRGVSDGVIRLNNAAEDNFTRLQFGGGTTSFPSLQRSGSALAVMDATGTALTNLLVGTTTDVGFRLDVNGDTRSTNIYTGTIFARSSGLIYSAHGAGNSFTHFFTVGNNQNATSGTAYLVAISSTFNPTSGTATFDGLRIANTINQTGGANGITRGLFVNPTLTAAADFRAIETTAGNVLFGSNFFWDNTNGRLGIGTSSPAYRLHLINGQAFLRPTGNSDDSLSISNQGFLTFRDTSDILIARFRAVVGGFQFQDASYNTKSSISVTNSTSYFNAGGGNVLIGTTTDAGFRLDVNGTFRVTGTSTFGTVSAGSVSAAFGAYSNQFAMNGTPFAFGITALFSTSGTSSAIASGARTTYLDSLTWAQSSGTAEFAAFRFNGAINTTGTYSGIVRGFHYNPTLTSLVGVTAHYAFHSTAGRVRFEGLPTSPTGLSAGDLYNDGGIIKIV